MPAFLTSGGDSGATTSRAVTLTPVIGATILVYFVCVTTTFSISDGTNTYTQLFSDTLADGETHTMWVARSVGSAPITITVTLGAANAAALQVVAYTGVNGGVVDQFHRANAATGTVADPGAIVPTVATNACVGFAVAGTAFTGGPSGWTQRVNTSGGGVFGVAWDNFNQTGSVDPTFAFTTSGAWTAAVADLPPAASIRAKPLPLGI